MNKRKWIIGFVIAVVFGFLSAGAGLVGDMGWKSFIAVLCASLGTNLTAYLMKHPIESIEDTEFIKRQLNDPKEGFSVLELLVTVAVIVGVAFTLLTLVGCARFGTTQKDITYDPATGNKIREITTKASAETLAASKSELAKWKASQSDQKQGAEVGGLTQQADASALVEAATRGAVKGAIGKP